MNQQFPAVRLPIVLLVDDDESIRRVVERHLRDFAVVISASTAARALEIVDQVRVDLVLSDFHMPGENGLTFLKEVAERDPATIRVLFSSDTVPGLQDFEDKGVIQAFIPKPWAPNSLRQVIESLLLERRGPTQRFLERRKAPRVQTTLRISYATKDTRAGNGRTLDLSSDGARIRGDAGLDVGELVSVSVESTQGSRVVGVAQVVWVGRPSASNEFGLRFLGFREPDSRRRLAYWVEEPR